MVEIERFGTGGIDGRELVLLVLDDLRELPRKLPIQGPHFACLVALDAQDLNAERLGDFAESLLSQGAVYVCAWGPDCERVHDIFDEEIVGGGPDVPRFDLGVMTTWHPDDDLDEALWYLLTNTSPGDEVAGTCRSTVVFAVAKRFDHYSREA